MAILAVANPIFQPSMRIVSDITNAEEAAVTTTFAHNYITGTIVRFHIPLGFGMVQANDLYGTITVTGTTTFTIDVNTSMFDTYATPATSPLDQQSSVVVAIGEVSSILTAAVENVLPYSG